MRSFFCNSAESCRKRVEIDLTRNFISVFSLIILVEIRGKYFYVNSTVRVQKGLHPACFINIFSPHANRPGCQQSGFRLARLYGATCIITNLFSLQSCACAMVNKRNKEDSRIICRARDVWISCLMLRNLRFLTCHSSCCFVFTSQISLSYTVSGVYCKGH